MLIYKILAFGLFTCTLGRIGSMAESLRGCTHLLSPIRATCHAHLIILDFITRIIFGDGTS